MKTTCNREVKEKFYLLKNFMLTDPIHENTYHFWSTGITVYIFTTDPLKCTYSPLILYSINIHKIYWSKQVHHNPLKYSIHIQHWSFEVYVQYSLLILYSIFHWSPIVQYVYMFRTMRSRDHNVVLIRRTIDLRCWEFEIGREWGGDGKGEVSLRVTWGQGGRDPIMPRRVSK